MAIGPRSCARTAAGIWGPKVMIINEMAGSGGDLRPWMFRKVKVGTIVGQRTGGGRVGMLGISYPGFYTSMGMIDSHPALKAASPQAPIADWFMGDDLRHNGAFFLSQNLGFFYSFDQKSHDPLRDGDLALTPGRGGHHVRRFGGDAVVAVILDREMGETQDGFGQYRCRHQGGKPKGDNRVPHKDRRERGDHVSDPV